ncbi:MAG: amidase family protein [bacterium]
MYLSDIFTSSANLAGLPGLVVPCGFDVAEMPIGLQILTPDFEEARALRIGDAYQRDTAWHRRAPSLGATKRAAK